MIPTSYKMSFQFAMPMKYTSYLKTMDKIKLFTTPILYIHKIKTDQLYYFRLFNFIE